MPYSQTPFGVLRTVDACELLQPPVYPLDSEVLAFSRRWQVVGIFLRCITCGHSHKASDSARRFPHGPACQANKGEDFPWQELAAILRQLPTHSPTNVLGTPGNDS